MTDEEMKEEEVKTSYKDTRSVFESIVDSSGIRNVPSTSVVVVTEHFFGQFRCGRLQREPYGPLDEVVPLGVLEEV